MKRGIYTVANDHVLNQLIALLNSLERNWPRHPLVCVIPHGDQCEQVEATLKDYKNVVMFDDQLALEAVDRFIGNLWMSLPSVVEAWHSKGKSVPHRLYRFRHYIGLTDAGLFDEYIYLDADIYIMRPMDELFDLLQHYDVVAHDYQGTDPSHIFNMESSQLENVLNGKLEDQIQCSGMIATKKGLYTKEEWGQLLHHIKQDEDVMYPWAPVQSLWCYLFNRFKKRFVNLVRYWPEDQVTRDAQTYTKFEFKDGRLYEGDKCILYFHHIGVPAEEFNRVSEGKEPKHQFRYQKVFKYFRFLNHDTDTNGSRHGKT